MLANDWKNNELDKDLLFPGNKVYSPDTCIFISGDLNKFLNENGSSRGEYPLGVSNHKTSGKIQAGCSNPRTGRREHLGYFPCPEEANKAWRARKHEHACWYADQQIDPRIAAALRARYA